MGAPPETILNRRNSISRCREMLFRMPEQTPSPLSTWQAFLSIVCLSVLTGCASIPPGERDPNDPHEAFNRSMYGFNDKLDEAILKPVSNAYTRTLPQPVRTGVSNFYSNITYLDTT